MVFDGATASDQVARRSHDLDQFWQLDRHSTQTVGEDGEVLTYRADAVRSDQALERVPSPLVADPLIGYFEVGRRHSDARPAGKQSRPVEIDEDSVFQGHVQIIMALWRN
jgi:hypothetical protein